MVLDIWRWLWVVLGGFQWFAVLLAMVKFCCLKLKRSRQLWGVFVVSSNNDAQSLKTNDQVFRCHLKRPWVGEICFIWWKLTYIALCKFPSLWLRFSSFWGNCFQGSPHLADYLLTGLHSRLSVWRMFLFFENLAAVIFSKFQPYLYQRR